MFTQKFLRSLIRMYEKIDLISMQGLAEFLIKTLKDKLFFEAELYQTRVELSKVYEGQG